MGDNEIEMKLAIEFIAEQWANFVSFCEERGEDAQQVYEAIGGED